MYVSAGLADHACMELCVGGRFGEAMVRMVASGAAAPTAWPRNGIDASYPWSFSGRFWFRPALVRAPTPRQIP